MAISLFACTPENNGTQSDTTDGTTSENKETSASTNEEESKNEESDTTMNTENVIPEGKLPGGEVKIISINLDANEATISKRHSDLTSLIKSYDPDSIGVQECRGGWHSKLKKGLEDKYTKVGVAADGQKESNTNFGTYIFYKTEKFNLIDWGTFWLSETPDIPSIYSNTVDCNRTCTWVILEDKETGFKYVHMNSHLDWMDVKATNYQIALIREQILRFEAMGLPVFATGDYNTDEGTDTYKIMLESDKIADSKHVADKTMNLGTYPDYGKYDVEKTAPIDFCFVTKDMMKVNEYKVIDEKPNGNYISDHFPLYINASLKILDDSFASAEKPNISSADISADSVTPDSFTVKLKNVSNKNPIVSYNVKITDASGNTVKETILKSGYMNKNIPDTLTVAASNLTANTEYTVTVHAKNLFGLESGEIKITVKTDKEPTVPVEANKADLFDLGIDANGNFVDLSERAMSITVQGTPEKGDSENKYIARFKKNGALKVPSFSDVYDVLSNGFTSELYVKINDTSTLQNYFANMHAGGFGYEVENGALFTYLHCGGEYKIIRFDVTANETYHLVTVYDKKELKLYVNGELAGKVSATGSMGIPTELTAQYLCIGADSDMTGNSENFADADIYIARLYSNALSEGQVVYLFDKANK